MSVIENSISIPLDEEGFFRRKCPLCCKEFKVLLTGEELKTVTQKGVDSYLIEQQENKSSSEVTDNTEQTCPYCGQSSNIWWTDEQDAYFKVYVENIIAKIINDKLLSPLKRISCNSKSGLFSLKFKGNEISQKELWISPDPNDLAKYHLPCCNREIKIQEGWIGKVYCFFCGFPFEK